LVEAVFDCFVEPASATADLAAIEAKFFSRFPDYRAESRQEWHQVSSRVEFKDGRAATPAFDSQLSGVRRWNSARNRGVLVGPGVLALNVTPPYGHFEDHLPHLSTLVEAFLEVAVPRRAQWLGHRFINHVELALDEDINPGALFTLYPQLSKARSLSHPPLVVQVEASRFEGGTVVTTLALAAKAPERVIYSLDIYARTDGEVELTTTNVTRWHGLAHGAIIDAFLGSITPEARRRFKERSS
jgi:uncharacterized protein (TIGR04255 family)